MPLFKRARGGVTSNQIVLTDFRTEVVDTDLTSVSSNDDTVPTA